MKEKIKKILEIIISLIALFWIFIEIATESFFHTPNLTVIIGIVMMWGICMYLLRKRG